MAVYERNFRPFDGELTPERTRFLVLPRYAYQRVLTSRIFVGLLVAWFLWPLALSILIYVPHNISLLERLGVTSEELSMFGAFRQDAQWFFNWFMIAQTWVCILVTVIIAPALISSDLRNNGLPLYLGRPFSRTEYILGKFSVLAILLSAISWVPGLALFFLRSYLAGFGWFAGNLRIGAAIFLGCWIWILVLSVLGLAASAHFKWRPVAGLAVLAVFVLSALLASTLNLMFGTYWFDLINLTQMAYAVWAHLFDIDNTVQIPTGLAWLSLLTFCSFCVWLLYRKIRAYEIVR
jgi:ABC-2 type transport system permease protein